MHRLRGIAQSGSAPALGAGGRRFKSCCPDHKQLKFLTLYCFKDYTFTVDKDTIVIIGGGLQGLTTANSLLDRGEKVLIVEKENETAIQTSFANAGMLTPSQAMPWNSIHDVARILSGIGRKNSPILLNMTSLPSLLFWGLKFLRNSTSTRFLKNSENSFRLAAYSKELTKQIRKERNLKYDSREDGTMKIFRTKKSLERAIKLNKKLSYLGIDSKILDPGGVVKIEPALKYVEENLSGGIFYPQDEIGDAYKFCKELEGLIREKGGRIHVSTEIKKILVNKKSINGLVTDRVEIKAKKIVLAAGSWSYIILKNIGLNLPVRPVKGYSLTLDTFGLEKVPKIAIIDESVHTAVTPLGDRLRVAGTAEFAGFNDDIDEGRLDNLGDMLKWVYPKVYSQLNLQESKFWCGFRPMSVDGLPYLGETKVKGLFVNVGQGHLGWTSSMGSGSLLADLMTGKKPELNPEPYLASRAL